MYILNNFIQIAETKVRVLCSFSILSDITETEECLKCFFVDIKYTQQCYTIVHL